MKEQIVRCIVNSIPKNRVERVEEYNRWLEWSKSADKRIIIFGAAEMCGICLRHLFKLGIRVDCICCNDTEQYGEYHVDSERSLEVVSVEEAMKDAENSICFVAVGSQHHEDIKKQLEEYHLAEIVMKWHLDFYLEVTLMLLDETITMEDNIRELFQFYEDETSWKILFEHFKMLLELNDIPKVLDDIKMDELCVKPQYFLEDGKYLEKQEVMVDCGAFIGDTLSDLLNVVKYDDFDKYECYEMDKITFDRLSKSITRYSDKIQKKINIYNLGVGDNDLEMNYHQNDRGGSRIASSGEGTASIIKLDNACKDKRVSFIKMDIEGSEQSALRGAEETIRSCKPMCAICIYHSISAFWDIPHILKTYVPEYKLILRHHTTFWDDSVCYAKVGEWE